MDCVTIKRLFRNCGHITEELKLASAGAKDSVKSEEKWAPVEDNSEVAASGLGGLGSEHAEQNSVAVRVFDGLSWPVDSPWEQQDAGAGAFAAAENTQGMRGMLNAAFDDIFERALPRPSIFSQTYARDKSEDRARGGKPYTFATNTTEI
jgi:hypothetical protein